MFILVARMNGERDDILKERMATSSAHDVQHIFSGFHSLEDGFGEILRRLENRDYYFPIRFMLSFLLIHIV